MSGQSLSRKMAGGAAWMIGARMVMRLSGLINIMILARLLPPAEFGVVGLTVAFIAAFEAMSDMSLNAAIVRHPAPQPKHYNTVWTLMVLRGLLLGGIALVAAKPLAAFYGDETLAYVAYALAAQQIILGLLNPGVSDFQRNFNFRTDFIYLAVRKLASTVACVGVALTIWPDYRALVAGLLTGSLATIISSYWLHPYRPRPSLKAFAEIFGFSKWMLATNLLQFAQRRADTFILGKTLGLTALGIHALAMELANLVATEFAMPLRRAFMPGYSKLQDKQAELRAQFCMAYGAAMVIAVPFAVGVASVAEPAIRLAFGGDWMQAVSPLRVLAFNGLFGASAVFCWPVIVAMGQPRRLAPLQLLSLLVGAPAIYFASLEWGLTGAAWAMTGMSALYALLVMRVVLRLMQAPAEMVLSWMPRVLAAALVMALSLRALQATLPAIDTAGAAGLSFTTSIAAGVITYPLALMALWALSGKPEGPEAMVLRLVRAKLGSPAKESASQKV